MDFGWVDGNVIAAAAASVFVASFVQALSGFGFALAAIPLLSMSLGPRDAVVVASALSILSSALVALTDRMSVNWPVVRTMFVWNVFGMPFGLLAFRYAPVLSLRVLIGIATIVGVGLLIRRPVFRTRSMDRAAGWVSGALSTSVGASGPPVVLAVSARGMGAAEQRATLATVFMVQNTVTVPLLLFSAGDKAGFFNYSIGELAVVIAVLFVPIIAGVVAGRPVARRISAAQFRRFTMALLVAAGLWAVLQGLTQ